MRTKTLLLSAAVGAAGLLAADAQVYSVNSVGYINLDLNVGYNLIANQLNNGNGNRIADLFAGANLQTGTSVFKWTGTGFGPADVWLGAAWLLGGNYTANPGEAIFVQIPAGGARSVTFVGEVPQGSLTVNLAAGFNFISSMVPQTGPLQTALGYTPAQGDTVGKWSGSGYQTVIYVTGPGWIGGEPTLGVGEGFYLQKTGSGTWTRNFSVNNN